MIFPYTVVIFYRSPKHDQLGEWLAKYVKPEKSQMHGDYLKNLFVFAFVEPLDAVLFKLRWGSA